MDRGEQAGRQGPELSEAQAGGAEGFARLLQASHLTLTGRTLHPDGLLDAAGLQAAPFCVLAHDGGTDPRFTYANAVALRCFGYEQDALIGLPSRLSAEPDARPERERLLAAVARDGFIEDYSGIRRAASGRRFRIVGVTVWTLVDERGARHGQAAAFAKTEPA